MQVQPSLKLDTATIWNIGQAYGNFKGRMIYVIGIMNEFIYKIFVLIKNLIPKFDENSQSFDELCLANQDKNDIYQSAKKAYMFRLNQIGVGTYYVLYSMLNNFDSKLKENEDLIHKEIKELKKCLDELKVITDNGKEFSEDKLQSSIRKLNGSAKILFTKITAVQWQLKNEKEINKFIKLFKNALIKQTRLYKTPSSDPSLRALWENYKTAEKSIN